MPTLKNTHLKYFKMAKLIKEGEVILPKKELKLFIESLKYIIKEEDGTDTETETNPVSKTFKQKGNFEQYIQKFSGLELKPKEIESINNYAKSKPTKLDRFSVRYENTDDFNNNTITVIKKLREGNDLVFTVFQSNQQTSDQPDTKIENEIIVNKSTSFKDEIEGGRILADILQKLSI